MGWLSSRFHYYSISDDIWRFKYKSIAEESGAPAIPLVSFREAYFKTSQKWKRRVLQKKITSSVTSRIDSICEFLLKKYPYIVIPIIAMCFTISFIALQLHSIWVLGNISSYITVIRPFWIRTILWSLVCLPTLSLLLLYPIFLGAFHSIRLQQYLQRAANQIPNLPKYVIRPSHILSLHFLVFTIVATYALFVIARWTFLIWNPPIASWVYTWIPYLIPVTGVSLTYFTLVCWGLVHYVVDQNISFTDRKLYLQILFYIQYPYCLIFTSLLFFVGREMMGSNPWMSFGNWVTLLPVALSELVIFSAIWGFAHEGGQWRGSKAQALLHLGTPLCTFGLLTLGQIGLSIPFLPSAFSLFWFIPTPILFSISMNKSVLPRILH